jgi:hypothetical protein
MVDKVVPDKIVGYDYTWVYIAGGSAVGILVGAAAYGLWRYYQQTVNQSGE